MSLDILEKVKKFLVRIVKDEDFRTQLMSDQIDEVKKVMADGGYNFSQEEFETAAIQILELKESGEFADLSEEELVGAFGGLRIKDERVIQPLYGVIYWPPKPWPRPKPWPQPQPLYGIVLDPPVQALYGVVVPREVQ